VDVSPRHDDTADAAPTRRVRSGPPGWPDHLGWPAVVVRTHTGRLDVVFPLAGTVDAESAARLAYAVRVMADHGVTRSVEAVTCDTSAAHVDLGLVGALARLTLVTRRHGCPLRVRGAGPDLVDLVDLLGLGGVVPVGRPSGVERR
jgi:STAS domain